MWRHLGRATAFSTRSPTLRRGLANFWRYWLWGAGAPGITRYSKNAHPRLQTRSRALRNCDIEAAMITPSENAVFIADCCGNTELGWRRNQASEVTKNFAATELSFFSRRRGLPLRIPHLNEPQTVKYYLHPSDSDGCRLLLNSLFCLESKHFVEVKCVVCLRQSLLAIELGYVSGKGWKTYTNFALAVHLPECISLRVWF